MPAGPARQRPTASVVAILKAETAGLSALLNPFDMALRYPSRSLSLVAGQAG